MKTIDKMYQGLISEDPKENEKLDMTVRMSNVEHEIINARKLIIEDYHRRKEDVERRKKYDEFLDVLMDKAKEDQEFWKEAKKKIILQGAWASIGIIGYALWYTLKSQAKG